MILALGEILFDIFPDYRRLGGAPFNFAFHLKQLGFPVRFVSRVGEDRNGKEIRAAVEAHGFNPADLQVDPRHATGTVDVSLNHTGVPKFDILPNVAYDHIDFTAAVGTLIEDCALIYFGTLIQRTDRGFQVLQKILSSRKSHTKCLYDINLRPDGYTNQVVRESLSQADLLKLNEEELDVLRAMHGKKRDEDRLVAFLREHYAIEVVALTRGHRGSTLFTADGRFDAPTPLVEDIVDTVGAGDAFASVLAAGYLRGLPAPKTLIAATRLAAHLCKVAGAIPDDSDLYADVLQLLER